MALTEKIEIDRIEVVSNWNIQVRQATIIERDGEQVALTFHRWLLTPDMDISDQEQKVQAICNVAWTDDVKAAYVEHQKQQSELAKRYQ
jgi:hypothetical protein